MNREIDRSVVETLGQIRTLIYLHEVCELLLANLLVGKHKWLKRLQLARKLQDDVSFVEPHRLNTLEYGLPCSNYELKGIYESTSLQEAIRGGILKSV